MVPHGGVGRIKRCSPCILEGGPARRGGASALERETMLQVRWEDQQLKYEMLLPDLDD